MMNPPSFLLDEHINRGVIRGLLLREPMADIMRVGMRGAPALSTLDPDLLCWIEEHDYLLVTNNRASMPIHLRDHLALGRHVTGILVIPKRLSLGELIDALHLIWGASFPGEFRDQIVYLTSER